MVYLTTMRTMLYGKTVITQEEVQRIDGDQRLLMTVSTKITIENNVSDVRLVPIKRHNKR